LYRQGGLALGIPSREELWQLLLVPGQEEIAQLVVVHRIGIGRVRDPVFIRCGDYARVLNDDLRSGNELRHNWNGNSGALQRGVCPAAVIVERIQRLVGEGVLTSTCSTALCLKPTC